MNLLNKNVMKQKKESNGADKVSEITQTKLAHAATELAVAKKWTLADFLRLFVTLIIPAGMIFSQYYFWVEINEFSQENLQLLILVIEAVTVLVLWYGFQKIFEIRAERIKLPKAGYDIIARRINTEEKIQSLEKKATKWELSDLPEWILILLLSGGIVYSGFQDWFLERFQLPVYPEYTSILVGVIGVLLFVWLVVKSRKEKKEECARQITELKQYL